MADELYQDFIIPYLDKDGKFQYGKAQVSKRLINENPDGWMEIANQMWRKDIERIEALDGEQ